MLKVASFHAHLYFASHSLGFIYTEIVYKGLEEDNTERSLKQLRDTGLAEHKADSRRPRTARTDENINLFDELVLSQEDTPQSYNIVI